MAVFPERIVLKNSTSSELDVRQALAPSGTDPAVPGELVVLRRQNSAKLLTVDSGTNIVSVGGADNLFELNDVALAPTAYTGFEDGHLLPTLVGGDSIATDQAYAGTKSLKNNNQRGWGGTKFVDIWPGINPAYTIWSLWYRSNYAASSNYIHYIGGNRDRIRNSDGVGLSLYNTGTTIGVNLKSIGGFSLQSGLFTAAADTWHHYLVQIQWNANILNVPTISVWLNGTLAVSAKTASTTEYIPGDARTFALPLVQDTNGSTNYRWIDEFTTAQTSTPIVSMTAPTIDPLTIKSQIQLYGPSVGDFLKWDGNKWVNGAGAGNGTVTSVDTGTGLTGGPITSTGTVSLADTAVTPGAYTNANITVDAQGRITAAASGSLVGSIDDLSDVDTTTTPPANGQALVWDGTNWIPGNVAAGGGGGGGSGTVLERVTDTETAASGEITFTGLGSSGVLVNMTSSLDAWITLYPTAADRTADAGRAYGTDPAPGSGVLAEFYITATGTILASPGTTYFNNDTIAAEAIYAAVRDQSGVAVDSEVTIDAYVHRNFGGIGTIRVSDSGTASSGVLNLTGIGQSGQLCTVTSDIDAWIVLYGSAADRTADSTRDFFTDPAPGSGVQAEFYVAAGTTILATPGSTYFNNDTSPTDAMYLAVRTQAGANADATVTIVAYAETSYTGISGGTFGSG
jgi:hypothetical protein